MVSDRLTYADVFRALQRDTPAARLVTMMKLRHRLSDAEWWPLLGLVWYASDSIHKARSQLTAELRGAAPEQVRMMMSGPSAAAWDALPPELTVYRGCTALNRPGLSWSRSRGVAEAFAHRHAGSTEIPTLMTGVVLRPYCVLMLDRGEEEVVSWNVWRVGQVPMAGTEA
jgi:hypothetical protein